MHNPSGQGLSLLETSSSAEDSATSVPSSVSVQRSRPLGATLAHDLDDPALTPKARRELAAAALLSALDGYLRVILGDMTSANEWVDQHTSPLGKRLHMEAVRRGDLRGVKHGRRILVRRADLDSFLANRSARRRASASDPDEATAERSADEVAASLLAHVGMRLRKA
jgi:hypothetical protein